MFSRQQVCCYEYIDSIKDIIEYAGQGLYSLDTIRTDLHDELCSLFNLDKEVTKQYTDNIDLNAENPAHDLYIGLTKESKRKSL